MCAKKWYLANEYMILCSLEPSYLTVLPRTWTMLEVLYFLLIGTCISLPLACVVYLCFKFRHYLPNPDPCLCLCKLLCCYLPFLWRLISPQCCKTEESSPVWSIYFKFYPAILLQSLILSLRTRISKYSIVIPSNLVLTSC